MQCIAVCCAVIGAVQGGAYISKARNPCVFFCQSENHRLSDENSRFRKQETAVSQ